MIIRPAKPDDAAAIADIYAHHVLHGTGTFEEDPPSVTEMAQRLAAIQGRGWPWLVAEADRAVIGYAYCGQLRERAAYRFACENSVYVRDEQRGRGVGRTLLDALMPAAAAAGFRHMFAVIGDSANAGSIGLHARAGFEHGGVWREAGFKFGRFLDVVHMQRRIDRSDG